MIRAALKILIAILLFARISFSQETVGSISHFDLSTESLQKKTARFDVKLINGVPVPYDFPEMVFSQVKSQSVNGKLFITDRSQNPYLMILENDGTPYFYRRLSFSAFDFDLQAGFLTSVASNQILVLDSTFTIVKRILPKADTLIDPHDFLLLGNGDYYMLTDKQRVFDMSSVIPGGMRNAILMENEIVGFDSSDNEIFRWKSKDYFHPGDAIHENLLLRSIDYVHINTIALDYDDNLIISSRNLSEVTKIDRKTGKIIWRLGGVNNQFELRGDTEFFSYQHDVRPIPGKPNHYTIFDNGNFRSNNYSRVIEYFVDTASYTAEKVWEYRAIPDMFTRFMGSAQRLADGKTLINWADEKKPKAMMVTPSGQVVMNANFKSEHAAYRTNYYEWEGRARAPYLTAESNPNQVNLIYNQFGADRIKEYIILKGSERGSLLPFDITPTPYISYSSLENHSKFYFAVYSVDTFGVRSDTSNIDSVETNFVSVGGNLVSNPKFDDSLSFWTPSVADGASANFSVNSAGELVCSISAQGSKFEDISLSQTGISLVKGETLVFEF